MVAALASNRDKNVRIAGTVLAYRSMSGHWRGIRVYYTDNRLNRGGERDMGDQVERTKSYSYQVFNW